MATSIDVKLTQAQKDRVDSVLNSSGLDPNTYRAWFSQQGSEWFFIPQGVLQAGEAAGVTAVAALVQSAAGPE